VSPVQLLALLPMTLAAAVRRSERRTIARLREAGANTAERGIVLERRRPLSRFVQHRLERSGVLLAAGNDRYYLNEAAYDAYRGRRQKRAMVIIALLLIGLAILYFRGDVS
jgi:hypothetical protein